MQANSIDEVLSLLDAIIAESRQKDSRLGYFPVLYREVTRAVKSGIAAERFSDGPRMEQLDVIFANRYFEAYQLFREGSQPQRAWQVCLSAAGDRRRIVLQHLLLGINAHINLDLGIAAAQTSPGDQLASLKGDFDEINRILFELALGTKARLSRVWPWLVLLDLAAGRSEDRIVNFSLVKARDHAWSLARTLAPLTHAEQEPVITLADNWAAAFGGLISNPGRILGWVLRIVRAGERQSVLEVIDLLDGRW